MESTAKKITITPDSGFVVISTKKSLTDRQLDLRAKKYADLDAEIKRLTAERDAVKAELIEAGTRATAHWSVTYTEYQQSRFDSRRFREDHPRQYAEYQTKVQGSKLTVVPV